MRISKLFLIITICFSILTVHHCIEGNLPQVIASLGPLLASLTSTIYFWRRRV